VKHQGMNVSGGNNDWQTPPWLLDKILAAFGRDQFDLDPCCSVPNVPASCHFTKAENGLVHPWQGVTFVNPPYGREIVPWMPKAKEEALSGRADTVLCLVYARSDTKWWQNTVKDASAVVFIRGRVNFVGGSSSSPTPSVIVIFGTIVPEVLGKLAELGHAMMPIPL
jgi:phage N-6-adenine-methyltransferase